jgi:hypothetical protein
LNVGARVGFVVALNLRRRHLDERSGRWWRHSLLRCQKERIRMRKFARPLNRFMRSVPEAYVKVMVGCRTAIGSR